jgi:DNA uptake protein ComE-like DNA-binding protein
MSHVDPRGLLAGAGAAGPTAGWLIVSSLWLIPVLIGGGTTTWIGFGIIGLVVLRRSWLVAAAVYAVLAFIVSVLGFSVLGPVLQIPLIIVGTIHALVANRTWLTTLWGRRERGERMLGRGGAVPVSPQELTPVPAPSTAARPASPAAVTPSLLAALAEERAQEAVEDVGPEPAATAVADPVRSTAPTSTPSSPVTPLRVDPISTVLTSALGASAITSLPMTVLGASSVVLPPREALNPMTATEDALAAIPVIGPAGAARIVAAREHHTLDSLQAVADAVGLQGFEFVRIRPFLRFD